MKRFEWNEEKNKLLREERQISFEKITEAVRAGKVLDRYDHPNKKKYPHQEIMVVKIDKYAYLVPFVEDEEKYFLKTIYKSRKATKKYIKLKTEDDGEN
jgi:uncharacterized DUF497 family protein